MKSYICENCGKSFEYGRKISLCPECRKQRDLENKKKFEEKAFWENQEKLSQGVEGVDYVIDQWNGLKTPRIYGKWFKNRHPGRTLDEYKAEFPDAPLYCTKDKENTSKNSGQFMKEEKYRKMYSEKMKGANNPNSKERATEEERKSRSPFSKKFAKYSSEEDRQAFLDSIDWSKVNVNTRVEYYTALGYDEETAKKMLAERQSTFTLEKCIEKYGEDEGRKIFNNRQAVWKEKMYSCKEKLGIAAGYSRMACDLIDNILLNESINQSEIKCYKTKEKWLYDNTHNRGYAYDLTYEKTKKIIEFNGDYWHANPALFEEDWHNNVKDMYAYEIWTYDRRKLQIAKNNGYKVLVIWESEYTTNPEETIKKAKEFLFNE